MGVWQGVDLDDVALTDGDVQLRPWRAADADAVYEAMQDLPGRRYIDLPDPYPRELATRFVTEIGNAGRRDGTELGGAVVEAGRVVGSAAVRLPRDGTPTIGYWTAGPAQGRGIASRATRLLAGWALGHGVARIEIRTLVPNAASAAVAMRAGFGFEGIARAGLERSDGRHDMVRFARTADDDGAAVPARFPRLPDGGLRDDAIALRLAGPQDADGWYEQEADRLSVANGMTGEAPPRERVRRLVERAALDRLVGAGPLSLVILDLDSGRFAGSIQLRGGGPPGVGDLGYTVHPAFRGRGYTARALRLVSAWAFEHAGYARLELGAKSYNVASQRAARAGGFEPDGVALGRLRDGDGSYQDEVRFALLRPATPGQIGES